MSPHDLEIERLPVIYTPPFDCINDNATCPACKNRRDDHGVSGSTAVFGVRADHEGRRYAVTIRVLGGDYLPITRQWWRSQKIGGEEAHRAADLTIHKEDPDGTADDCTILGDGRRCRPSTGFLAAEELFDEHGESDASTDVREQPEELWAALEHRLVEAIFGTAGGLA